ncbi:MAG: PAS domain-containing protein, partial [Calditrichaeota bacterium]
MSHVKTATGDFWCAVLDTAMDGLIAVDHRGRIRHVNPAAAELLDLNPAVAVGRHFRTVFCPSLPEEKCWVNVALADATSVRNYRFEMELAGGSRRELTANLTVFGGEEHPFGALIALRPADMHGGLHREREKQAAILGSLAEGLFTVDNEWRITSFNRAAEQMTGWREEEVLDKHCKDVLGSRQCVESCPLAETLRRSRP